MGFSGLSRPAADAARDKHDRRRPRWPDTARMDAVQWAAALVIASGVVIGISKLIKGAIRPARTQPTDVEALPTHVLVNGKGVEVHISPVGAVIERINMPDRSGQHTDVVLGFDQKTPYATDNGNYFGIIVGRCANRIAYATFEIDDKRHHVTANDGMHSLHGGKRGWGMQVWDAEKTTYEGSPAVRLTYRSKDGEEGYPGNVEAVVTYVLEDGNTKQDKGYLRVLMEATTDQATPVNMAQHTYWNLAGSGTILGHSLCINADHYTPVTGEHIPTGDLEPVKGTPFDFVKARKIGARIAEVDGGYDHNFALKSSPSTTNPKLRQAAVLTDPGSGRSVEVATSAPGLQFYSGNFLDGTTIGKGGVAYPKYGGVALESQAFPNSVNEAQFQNVILRPGETYHHEVAYTLKASK